MTRSWWDRQWIVSYGIWKKDGFSLGEVSHGITVRLLAAVGICGAIVPLSVGRPMRTVRISI